MALVHGQADQEALREKLYAAEQRIALIRVEVIALNTVTYFTIFDRTLGTFWLAVLIVAVAWLYAVPVVIFQPYRRMAFLMGSLFTTVTDGLLISFWLVVTGGYDSPYFLLWYASIVSLAFRFDFRRTMLATALDGASYVAIVAAMGQLPDHLGGMAIRVGYIYIIGAIGGEAAREAFDQVRSRLRLRDQVRIIEEAEAKFRAVAENANDLIFTVDSMGRIVYLNPYGEALFGCAGGELLGQPFGDLLSPTVRPLWQALLTWTFGEDSPAEPVQLVGMRKDGREVPLDTSLARWTAGGAEYMTGIARDATERRRHQAQLEYQSMHDALTDLPNRLLLRDRLQTAAAAAARDGTYAALLLLDLDYFKEVNDTFGHVWGDRILKAVARRLSGGLREADTVARLGGDEFALVLPVLRRIEDAPVVAKKILQALERPFHIEGQTIAICASVGIVVAPDHGHDADTLLRHADAAMYAAKAQRNGYVVFDFEQDASSAERLRLTADLRGARQARQLVLDYQPQVDFGRQGRLEVEALVRWRHPVHGILLPGQFIPLAERTGLINDLTDWVLQSALTQARDWLAAGIAIPVAVNLSARSLHDPALRDRIQHALETWRVPPRLLKLEITESTVMSYSGRAHETLRRLSSLGVLLSIDDFGTGYSSFAYLKELPVGELKIDRSFVKDMLSDEKDAAIVRSIVDLAHNLGMVAVAEGIESEDVCNQLREIGCDRGQGYYVGKPMPPEQLHQWVETVGLMRSLRVGARMRDT